MAAIRQVLSSVFVFTVVLAAVAPCNSSLSCNVSDADVSLRNTTACGKLIMAHVVLNPGRYASFDSSANGSAFSDDIFSGKFERLTQAGIQDLYNLGEWFRERYTSILPFNYLPDHVLVRSSNSAKALESVQCVLATLFPPEGENFEVGLNWQPVPIHSLPQDMDELVEAGLCDRYESLLNQLKNSPEMQYVNRDNWELYKGLSKVTGRKIASIGDLARLYDILEAEISINATLPKWLSEFFPGQLLKFSILNYQIPTFTPELKRLKLGAFLQELGRHMSDKVDGSLRPNRTLFIYSVTEETLASLLNALGTFNCLPPPKSATITIDLWASADNDFYVTVSYKNETGREPYILRLPACPHVCPLHMFIHIMTESIPQDWSKDCTPPEQMSEIVLLKTACVFIVLLIITLVMVLVRLWVGRNNRYKQLG